MKVDVTKAQTDLDTVREQMIKCRERLSDLTSREISLVAFLDIAETYKVSEKTKPLARKDVVLKNGTIVSQAIVGAFKAGDLLTTKQVLDTIDFVPPNETVSPLHHLSAVMTHEIRRANGILEHVGKGQYRLKDNAAGIVAARVAAERSLH